MNKIELVEFDDYNPTMGHIYSVAVDDSDKTLFDLFLEENITDYRLELAEIITKLKTMSSKTGFTDNYFKLNEGTLGDGVCAITDLKRKLRLYCIRFREKDLIIEDDGSFYGNEIIEL